MGWNELGVGRGSRATEHRKLSAFPGPCQRTRGIPGRSGKPRAVCPPSSGPWL